MHFRRKNCFQYSKEISTSQASLNLYFDSMYQGQYFVRYRCLPDLLNHSIELSTLKQYFEERCNALALKQMCYDEQTEVLQLHEQMILKKIKTIVSLITLNCHVIISLSNENKSKSSYYPDRSLDRDCKLPILPLGLVSLLPLRVIELLCIQLLDLPAGE